MNRFLFATLLCGLALPGQAQDRNANWLMPANNWLSFSNSPPTAAAGGNVTGVISSCMSDPSGMFLFHTDALGVLNAQHQLMANGPPPITPYIPNNLTGKSTQGLLTVTKLG